MTRSVISSCCASSAELSTLSGMRVKVIHRE